MAASALISAYWAAGGTGLLDTVGGPIARWGRHRGVQVRLALALIVALKLIVARLPVAAMCPRRRSIRRLAWLEAIVLTAYGGLLTDAGLAIQPGLLRAGLKPDWTALDWHVYLWDPWFLVAGVLLLAALRAPRPARPKPPQYRNRRPA